ncbi:MAG: 4-hydroxy-tetrahydrodipicolinate synthase [Proteobacteria bacterium]|nr:4-hydroxy-tetrahydrodipicolinate synthase [Pseudomonadota bacterium]
MFKGSIVALVTPFNNGAIDEKAFQDLVEWHISEGTHGIVPVGTTGESPTLTHEEHKRVTELCVEAATGRVPVIAGTGSNATAEAIEYTQHAQKAGADAALIVAPYYNKPTQDGLFAHFKAIHDATDIPIILYNVPSRTVADIAQETIVRLADLPNIVGIKDATANLARVSSTRLLLGPQFCQLSGEDPTVLAFMAHGGHGCISVTANIAPRLCAEFQNVWAEGRPLDALALHDRLMPLHIALFLETSPAPAKYALSLLGKCTDELRLPLVGLGDQTKERVRTAMKSAGLIE